MFIKIVPTPNPLALKFIPPANYLQDIPQYTEYCRTTSHSPVPLVAQIFESFSIIEIIGLSPAFIVLQKNDPSISWNNLKIPILNVIIDMLTAYPIGAIAPSVQKSLFFETTVDQSNTDNVALNNKIQQLINEKIKPQIEKDGGNIVFHGMRNFIVYIELQGACKSCPSAALTLKHGIENILFHYVPEIKGVENIA